MRSAKFPIAVFALLLAATALKAQPVPQLNLENPGYPVTVEGQEVLRIYEGIGSFTAQDRSQAASERFEKLIYAPAADLANIAAGDSAYGTAITLGDNVLLVVTDDDARHFHMSRQVLANLFARRIRDAISEARLQHSAQFLIRAAIYAVITLALYLLIVWLVVRATRWLLTVLRSMAAGFKGIRIQQSQIIAGERMAAVLIAGVQLVRFLLLFVFTWIFLATEFNYFPWTREHGARLLSYIGTPVKFIGLAFLNYLPNLLYIVVIVAAMYYLLKFVQVLTREVERGNIRISGFYPEWSQPTYKIVRFLLFAFTAVIIYPYLPGENSPAFKGVGIFIGVLFSLGSTSAVANVVAGVILIYTRGFRVGDWVKIGDNMGEVTVQTMLATHVKTIRNEEIIIPNSVVLASFVTNYSLLAQNDGLILHTSVTIGYDTPWRKVHELLIEAALKTKNIVPSPAPFVLQNALEDSYVQYEINAYTDHPLLMVYTYSDLHANIQDCFYAAGVEIMSPVYHSLRDGNRAAIPAEYLPKDYHPRGFRIAKDDAAPGGKS
ncbi:MAG: mechanosensitive ion channel family protein [Candidatus Korobacteraceae bacterium]